MAGASRPREVTLLSRGTNISVWMTRIASAVCRRLHGARVWRTFTRARRRLPRLDVVEPRPLSGVMMSRRAGTPMRASATSCTEHSVALAVRRATAALWAAEEVSAMSTSTWRARVRSAANSVHCLQYRSFDPTSTTLATRLCIRTLKRHAGWIQLASAEASEVSAVRFT